MRLGKFAGSFFTGIMKKAAQIIGIISVGFVLLGTIFRFLHFPGGGVLIVLFSGVFAGFALPLNLLALRREKKSRTRTITGVLGTLFAMHAVVILLFLAQNWPGWNNILLQGVVLFAGFIVFVVLSLKHPAEPIKLITTFNVMFVVMLALLSLSWMAMNDRNEERDQLVQLNQMQVEHCDSLRRVVDLMYYDLSMDTSSYHDSTRAMAYDFQMESQRVTGYIKSVQQELVSQNNYGTIGDTSLTLQDPMNVDFTSFYFIGEDIQNPTGKAVDLFSVLRDYRENVLHPEVPFFIRIGSTHEEATQWVKDNFYKATAIEVMTRLTLLKENVYQAMQYSIDRDLFVQRR